MNAPYPLLRMMISVILPFFCVLFLLNSELQLASASGLPQSEYLFLYELYNATNGPWWNWRNLTEGRVVWQFNTPADPCADSWQGIDCDTVGEPPHDVSYIRTLDLRERNLTGTLPSSVNSLTRLELLELPRNQLSGTIPRTISTIGQLSQIMLDYNSLSGPLPHFEVNNTAGMRTIILAQNHLTGTIPDSYGRLKDLLILYLNGNSLHGTIPAVIGNLSRLSYLDLDGSGLIGSIPEAFSNLTHLLFLGLDSNHLTGTLPAFLGEMQHLQFLYLSDNKFHGTIPSTLGRLENLLFLHLYDNYLTGTIPTELGVMKRLQYLYLYNNLLTGSLPNLSHLKDLYSLLAQGNDLSGSLDGVFNSTTQPYVTTIQLSNNQFTGTLPEEVLSLNRLSTLIIVSNCLHGSLTTSICAATGLQTLVLDGLHSASSCQGFDLPGFTVDSHLTDVFGGSIPTCLFQLPSLNTLHLSGNSLTGSLPGDLQVSAQLLDLDLSHNYLSGSIPSQVQARTWYNLDLSYNRFSGVMESDFYQKTRNFTFNTRFEQYLLNISLPVSSAALNVENNRLSGVVPNAIKSMLNVSVLQGNLFACGVDRSDLPQHDEDRGNYQCSSSAFDYPYYAWLVIVFTIAVVVLSLWYWRLPLDKYLHVFDVFVRCQKWLNMITHENGLPASINVRLQNISYVNLVCDAICRVSLYAVLFILLLLLPLYAVISEYYGTHTHQYTYTVSSTFQSGVVPFAIELVLLAALMVLIGVAFAHHMKRVDATHGRARVLLNVELSTDTAPSRSGTRHAATRLERASIRFAFFAINAIVVLGANIAFVYIAIYESAVALTVAQVGLSMFKFLWNTVCNPFLIRWTAHRLSSSEYGQAQSTRAAFFSLQLFVSLFNNIAIPCLVVGAVDPSCFYNVIVPASTETSHYVYAECLLYTILGCIQVVPHIATVSYDPPFQYSYQCSSSFITYYAPTYVYMCFVSTFVAPITQLIAQRVHLYLLQNGCTYMLLFRILDFCLPPVLKPLEYGTLKRNVFKPYFDANLVLISLLNYLGVMLTFGAVFPPLGAAIFVSIVMLAYFAKLKIGRLICNVINEGLYNYLDIIETECRRVGSVRKLRQSVWMLVTFSCVFYTLFLFDTLGNKVGFVGAVWVVFEVPLSPLCAYAAIRMYAHYFPSAPLRGDVGSLSSTVIGSTELTHMSNGGGASVGSVDDAGKLAKELQHDDTVSVLHETGLVQDRDGDVENGAK